jgi:4-hydroxy-3-methylbut-2-enyl diphosphate reductase
LNKDWFQEKSQVGITAGASTPEVLVQEVLDVIKAFGVANIQEMDAPAEKVTFALPAELAGLKTKTDNQQHLN